MAKDERDDVIITLDDIYIGADEAHTSSRRRACALTTFRSRFETNWFEVVFVV